MARDEKVFQRKSRKKNEFLHVILDRSCKRILANGWLNSSQSQEWAVNRKRVIIFTARMNIANLWEDVFVSADIVATIVGSWSPVTCKGGVGSLFKDKI